MTLKMALEACVVANSESSKSFIYKKYYGYLMAISLRYVKNEMESEDIVNEAFIKIFNKLSSFSREDDEQVLEKTFKSWIARIAVNTSIDKLRAKKETHSLDDIYESDLVQHAVYSANTLEVNDILNLLNTLPDIQRSIFNLYEVEGYSHEEIAKILEIPESTSRTYLTRAKSKLRKLYNEQFSTIVNINHS